MKDPIAWAHWCLDEAWERRRVLAPDLGIWMMSVMLPYNGKPVMITWGSVPNTRDGEQGVAGPVTFYSSDPQVALVVLSVWHWAVDEKSMVIEAFAELWYREVPYVV